jgi:Carboxypeptidase regulatory-like domain
VSRSARTPGGFRFCGGQVPRGMVVGTVRSTASGQPIPEARIEIPNSGAETQSSASGGFSLSAAPLGTQVVEIAAVGFVFQRQIVDIRATTPVRLDLELPPAPQVLPTIGVIGNRGHASSFEERRHRGVGYFLTAEDLKQRGVHQIEDIFYGVPGFRVLDNGSARASPPTGVTS